MSDINIQVNPSPISVAVSASGGQGGTSGINLNALQPLNISSAGDYVITPSRGITPCKITLSSGSGDYTATIFLSHTGATEGDMIKMLLILDASSNQTVSVYDQSTAGTELFSWSQTGTASIGELEYIYASGSWVQLGENLIFTNSSSSGGGASLNNAWGFWKLSDNSDASGNGRTLTETGSPTFGPGVIGNAATFDGSSGLSAPAPANVFPAFSIAFWAASTTSDGVAFSAGINDSTDTGNGAFRLIAIGSLVVWQIAALSDTYSNVSVSDAFVTDGSWQHFAGTFDGTVQNLYKNGSLIASNNTGFSLSGSFGPQYFGIGADGDGASNATGSMDEVGVWAYALTSDQIASLYNNGSGYSPY